jgi:ornithine decarboxylase
LNHLTKKPLLQEMTQWGDVKDKVLEFVRHSVPEINEITEKDNLVDLLKQILSEGVENAFFLVDLGTVMKKYEEWSKSLPRVKPFYAIKCNPDEAILKTLKICGCGYDCASQDEIKKVLAIGVAPSDIIFANPCKSRAHIRYAVESGVRMMTFDNPSELRKINDLFPAGKTDGVPLQLVLRILPDDSHSTMPFGSKFGAHYKDSLKLIELAKELGLNIVGVSFHVGSGCYSAEGYVNTIKMAKKVFDKAEEAGFNMKILDIGGGWPGSEGVNGDGTDVIYFPEIAAKISPVLDELFPKDKVSIISEPGRFFVSESMTLAVTVISRRKKEDDEYLVTPTSIQSVNNPTKYLYYVSDGIYGSFNCIMFDHAHPVPEFLTSANPDDQHKIKDRPTYVSKLFGPTCDSMDVICKDIELPELEVGDWLYFRNMGVSF